MIHLIPEIPFLWIGRGGLRDTAEQRIDFLLVGTDDHIRHHTAEIVLDRKTSDGKHLRYIRVGFIFHRDHILIGIALVGHGTAIGLDVHDIRP